MTDPFTSELLSPLHASAAMRTVISDRERLQRMLDFEAALARAEGALGVISATSAVEIAQSCVAERYDLRAIAEAAAGSGDTAAAVVEALTANVALHSPKASNSVHWGASSQDLIDTALVLELRAAIDVLVADLDAAIKGFTALAGRHRRTLTAARVMLQQSQPIPFGLRIAGYAAALARSRERLLRLRREALLLQFGGISGTLAALGKTGADVADRLAALLDVQLPEAPWHAHRDRLAEIGASFAILAGTCGKIARDIAVLMQIEVGETPVQRAHLTNAAAAISAATQAPNLAATLLAAQAQDHEGGLGGSLTEWTTFPTLALVTSGALDAVVKIAEGLEIDVERARTNLDRSGGRIMTEAIVFALAEKMDRAEARQIVEELSLRADQDNVPLRELALTDPRVKAHLGSTEIEMLFVPMTYLGWAQLFIDRLVYAAQARTSRRPEFRSPDPKLPSAPQLHSVAPPAVATTRDAVAPAVTAPEIAVAHKLAPAPDDAATVEPLLTKPSEPIQAEPSQPVPDETADGDEPQLVDEPAIAETVEPELSEFDAAAPAPDGAAIVTAEFEQPVTATEPVPEPEPATFDDDAPGAFMDVLSRADAEARAAERRKRS